MEDLTGKITELLSDPETLNKIKSLSGLLGSSNSDDENSQEEGSESGEKEEGTGFSFSPEMMQMILKLMPILSSIKKEDKYTRFLAALRPLLSESKQKKLDGSTKILQIIRILPILKSQGILWGEK